MNSLFEAIAEKNLKNSKLNKPNISKLIDHMTQFYMTKNLWVLEEIINHINDPLYIASLMIHIDKKPLEIKIKNIGRDVEALKTNFYFNISSRSNVKESLMILAYLSKKHFDFCGTILNYLLEQDLLKCEIKKYICACKTLYDANPCKKRINLIYYAVYVYTTEHVNYIPLEKPHDPLDYLFVYLERDTTFEEQVEKDREIYKDASNDKINYRIINVS